MDYFSRNRPRSRGNAVEQAAARPASAASGQITPGTAIPLTPGGTPSRNPAPMRLRRLPSSNNLRPVRSQNFPAPASRAGARSPAGLDGSAPSAVAEEPTGRRRSFSDPERTSTRDFARPNLNTQETAQDVLPTVMEERTTSNSTPGQQQQFQAPATDHKTATGRLRAASGAAANAVRGRGGSDAAQRDRRGSGSSAGQVEMQDPQGRQYEAEVTDFLDVIDPEVSTLNTLNNVQNSLFIPYLGRWYSRQPTYTLSRPPTMQELPELPKAARTTSRLDQFPVQEEEGEDDSEYSEGQDPRSNLQRLHTIKSTLSGMSVGHNYAVLPHGVRLEGWTEEEMDELNDHVRHLLHSRREGFKRSMRAFGKYVRKPMGFFVTLYAFIITFWGAAWVLFLIGWIHAGDRQAYFVEICDQILTAMLVVFGIGLFPWRCVDTYHMIYIAHYHYKVWKLRNKQGVPALPDPNDLPDTDPRISSMLDPEEAAGVREKIAEEEAVMLPIGQQKKLKHHQDKMAKSHTYFKPHETATHYAFPIKLLISIIVILDFHSFFQMALGGTTWGIYYRDRPRALTAIILAFSISCNITGGILISIGDKRTRKKELFEQIFRQKRTDEAMKKMEKKKGKTRLTLRKSIEDLEQEKKEQEASEEEDRTNAQALRQAGAGAVA